MKDLNGVITVFLQRVFIVVMTLVLGVACSQQTKTADPGLTGEDLDTYLQTFLTDPGELSTQSTGSILNFYELPGVEIYFAEGCTDASACPMGSAYSVLALDNAEFLGLGDFDPILINDARVTFFKYGFSEAEMDSALLLDFELEGTFYQRYFTPVSPVSITTDELTQRKKFEVIMADSQGQGESIRLVTFDFEPNGEFKPVISMQIYYDDPATGETYYIGRLSTLVGFY